MDACWLCGELEMELLLPVFFHCFGSVQWLASANCTNVFVLLRKKIKFLKEQNLSAPLLQMKHMVRHDATLRIELISAISFLNSLTMLRLSLFPQQIQNSAALGIWHII